MWVPVKSFYCWIQGDAYGVQLLELMSSDKWCEEPLWSLGHLLKKQIHKLEVQYCTVIDATQFHIRICTVHV